MALTTKDLTNRKVIVEDLVLGTIKEKVIDPKSWKITHLELKLSKKAADEVLGAKKRGIRNLLAVSALKSAQPDSAGHVVVKVKKGQLPIYLKSAKR